ncbi:MAG: tetratricopeptide repeat protein [Nitrospirae bacterium]|nr:tetratricopeptide repeat protein [Nitrospirota bacterium]
MKILIISALIIMILFTAQLLMAVEDQDLYNAIQSYKTKHYAKAIESLDLVISRDPIPQAYYLKGYSLYKLNKNDEAEKNFKEVFFLDPEFNVDQFMKEVYAKDKTVKPKKGKKHKHGRK